MSNYSWSKPTYFFGYGSLMYPSGINPKGMKYKYDWQDLHPAILFDHIRGLYACCINNYYSIVPLDDKFVNGVTFEIHSAEDFEKLLADEGAGLMYEVAEVTDKIHQCFDGKVFTLVNRKDKIVYGKGPLKSYIRNVYKGIQILGPNFVSMFLETGGIKPSPRSGILPIYSLMRNPLIRWTKKYVFMWAPKLKEKKDKDENRNRHTRNN